MHLVLVVWIAPHIRQMPDVCICVSVCLCIRALKSNIRTNLPLILYMCMSISLICCMYDVWCMLYAIHHSMSDVLMNDRYFDSLSLSQFIQLSRSPSRSWSLFIYYHQSLYIRVSSFEWSLFPLIMSTFFGGICMYVLVDIGQHGSHVCKQNKDHTQFTVEFRHFIE